MSTNNAYTVYAKIDGLREDVILCEDEPLIIAEEVIRHTKIHGIRRGSYLHPYHTVKHFRIKEKETK